MAFIYRQNQSSIQTQLASPTAQTVNYAANAQIAAIQAVDLKQDSQIADIQVVDTTQNGQILDIQAVDQQQQIQIAALQANTQGQTIIDGIPSIVSDNGLQIVGTTDSKLILKAGNTTNTLTYNGTKISSDGILNATQIQESGIPISSIYSSQQAVQNAYYSKVDCDNKFQTIIDSQNTTQQIQESIQTIQEQLGSTSTNKIQSGLQDQISDATDQVLINSNSIISLQQNVAGISQVISDSKTQAISSSNAYTDVLALNLSTNYSDTATMNVSIDNAKTQAINTAEGYTDTQISNLNFDTTYLKIVDASAEYQKKSDMQNYPLTQDMNIAIQAGVSQAEGYTDTQISNLNFDSTYLKISTAEAQYQKITDMINFYTKTQTDSAITTGVNTAKSYTDTQLAGYYTKTQSDATTQNLQTQINQIASSDVSYEGYYVNESTGSDTTGNGSPQKPWASVQKVLNTYNTTRVIYVKSSTTANIVFNALNQSIQIVMDPKTQHSGSITLVNGNTSIYFLGKTAWLRGAINDTSKGTVYYDCVVSGVYTKNPTVSGSTPVGYVEFGRNSSLDGLQINLLSNTMIVTYGLGAMGPIEQTNGLLVLQHSGSVNGASPNTSAIHITSPDVAAGQVPITLIQGQIQLLSPYSAYALYCQATYGYLFLANVSTLQADMSSYKNIQANSSATYVSKVWASVDCPPANLALYNPSFANHANNIKADYPTTVNYTLSGSDIVSNHLNGIDAKIGTMNTTITGQTTTLAGHTSSINTLNAFMASAPTTFLNINTAANTYLSQSNASLYYLLKADAFTQSIADGLYQSKGNYLVSSDLTNALLGYYDKTACDARFQPIGTYVIPSDLSVYQLTSNAFTQNAADLLYSPIGALTQTTADSRYVLISGAFTQTIADGLYQPKGTYISSSDLTTALLGYYDKTASDSRYQLQSNMSAYLLASNAFTQSAADLLYQPKGTYLVAADLTPYLLSSTASSTYKSISSFNTDIANYLLSSTAASTYTTQTFIASNYYTRTYCDTTFATKTSLNTTNTNVSTLQTFQGSLTNANLNTSLTAANDFNACHFTYSGTTTSSNQDIFQIINRTTSTNPVLRFNKDLSTNQTITYNGTRLESSGAFYATDIACGGVSSLSTALPSLSTRITSINYTSNQNVLGASSGVLIYNATVANPSLYFKDSSTNQGMLQFDGTKMIMDRVLSTQGFMNLGYTQLNHSKYGASSFMCNGFPNNGYSSVGARNSFWGYACCNNANYQDLCQDNTCFGANISLGTQGSVSYNTCIGSQISTQDNPRGCTYIGSQVTGSGATNETVICSGNLGLSGYGNNTTLIKAQSGGIYRSDNSANFNTTSDQRIKKDITDNTSYTLDKLMQIKLRDFNYKTMAEEPTLIKNEYPVYSNKETGLIVQEVQNIFPDCIITPPDPTTQPYSIDYHYVNLLLIASVQQLTQQVNTLKEQLAQADAIKPGDVFMSYPGQSGQSRNGHMYLQANGFQFDSGVYPDLYKNLGNQTVAPNLVSLGGLVYYIYVN